MFVLLFENNMLASSDAYVNIRTIASLFWMGNIFLILLITYLENTGRDIIICVKMLFLRNKSHVLIPMIVVETEI